MQSQRMNTNPKAKIDMYAVRLHTLYAGGLIGISLVIFQGFIGLGKLDTPALISVLTFACAIPLLSGILVANVIERRYQYSSPDSRTGKVAETCFYLGILIDLVGIGAAFWHVSFIAGIVFIITTILSGLLYSIHISKLSESPDI